MLGICKHSQILSASHRNFTSTAGYAHLAASAISDMSVQLMPAAAASTARTPLPSNPLPCLMLILSQLPVQPISCDLGTTRLVLYSRWATLFRTNTGYTPSMHTIFITPDFTSGHGLYILLLSPGGPSVWASYKVSPSAQHGKVHRQQVQQVSA